MEYPFAGCGDEIYLLIEDMSLSEFADRVRPYYFAFAKKSARYKNATLTAAAIELNGLNASLFTIGMNSEFVHDPMFEPVDLVRACFPDTVVAIGFEENLHILQSGKTVATLFGENPDSYFVARGWEGQFPSYQQFLSEEDGEAYLYRNPIDTYINHKHASGDVSYGKSVWVPVVIQGEAADGTALSDELRKDIDYWRFTETLWDTVLGEGGKQVNNESRDNRESQPWVGVENISADDIPERSVDMPTGSEPVPAKIIDMAIFAYRALVYKNEKQIRGYLLLVTREQSDLRVQTFESTGVEHAIDAVNQYLDENRQTISEYALVNRSYRQDHPKAKYRDCFHIEAATEDDIASYTWVVSPEGRLSFHLKTTNRLVQALEKADIHECSIGPNMTKLALKVIVLILGVVFVPYMWVKALLGLFLALVLYMNARPLKLTMSKDGFHYEGAKYCDFSIRDIEAVVETNAPKMPLMVLIKGKCSGPPLKNSFGISDEKFEEKIRQFCQKCSIAYVEAKPQ